jgi:predicted transcriptional regulator
MPRKLYTFAIDPDLAAALKRLKTKTGVPESETVRRALRGYLRRQGALIPTRVKTASGSQRGHGR